MNPTPSIRAGIIGASGYAGQELLRLLTRHPSARVALATSTTQAGKRLAAVLPAFEKIVDISFRFFSASGSVAAPAGAPAVTAGDIGRECDVVFVCVPHGEAMPVVDTLMRESGTLKIIDISADFRLTDPARYKAWYGREHTAPAHLPQAVYGLTEWARQELKTARLVANPGCYATSILLALNPLLAGGLADLDAGFVVDSKSGISGAGKKPAEHLHFPEMNENLQAYKVGKHQHMGEILQLAARWAGREPEITFVPHLVPLTRGIFTTLYARLRPEHAGLDTAGLRALFAARYADAPFVRVVGAESPRILDVAQTNFCDIAVRRIEGGRGVVVMSAIDNLGKGAAGQAVQNMNVLFNLNESAGLL